MFLNPLEILSLENFDISEINSDKIKKSKKRLISEIKLSDTEDIEINGIKIIASDVDNYVNMLESDNIKFFMLLSQNKELSDFLKGLSSKLFENYTLKPEYNDKDFLNLISKYFKISYQKLLTELIKNKNYNFLKLVLSIKPLVNENEIIDIYTPIKNKVCSIENEINQLINEIEKEDCDIDNIYSSFLKITNSHIFINQLNLSQFNKEIKNYCLTIRKFAIDLFNNHDKDKFSIDIINNLLDINIPDSIKEKLNKDIIEINEIIKRDEKMNLLLPYIEYVMTLDALEEEGIVENKIRNGNKQDLFLLIYKNESFIQKINDLNYIEAQNIREKIVYHLTIISVRIIGTNNNLDHLKLCRDIINNAGQYSISHESKENFNKVKEHINATVNKKDSDCYIATSVYESPYHGNVLILRKFRDEVLKKYIIGRFFIFVYYWIGPKFAKLTDNNILLKLSVRSFLDRICLKIRRII